MKRIYVVVSTILVVLYVAATGGSLEGQSTPSERASAEHKHPMLFVEEAGRRARSHDATAVRAFTDEILNRSLLASVAPSVRERVANNDLAFRRGEMPAIEEERLVQVANETVHALGGPRYFRLSKGQLNLVRRDLRFFVRHFAGSDPTRGTPPNDMSPAEVVLVSTDLLLQKLYHPEYQVEPEQWEQESRQRRNATAQNGTARKFSRSFSVNPAVPIHLGLRDGLSDESGAVVAGLHTFLDRIGFAR